MINKLWQKITLIGVKETLESTLVYKITNTNRFILFYSTIFLINFFLNYSKDIHFYNYLNFGIFFILLSFLFLNYLGYYRLSSNLFILFLNSITFVLASIGGNETGLFMLFFPLIVISFFIVGINEIYLLVVYMFLPILLLLITIFTDYSLFQFQNFKPYEIRSIYNQVMMSLIAITAFILYNVIVINEKIVTNLLEERAYLDGIFNNSVLNIILLDAKMKVKAFNKLAKNTLYNSYAIDIRNEEYILDYILENEKENFIYSFNEALNGNTIQIEKNLNLDLKGQWYEIHFYPSYDEKQIINGVNISAIEISERKNNEMKINMERRNAEAANINKSHFLSTMGNEIRSPMNAIIGIIGFLLTNKPRMDQVETLNVLKFSAENLLVIINDILDFNRIDSGKIEIEEIEFNLKHLVVTISHFLSPLVKGKPIIFTTTYDENIPSILLGDSVRLSQIITNLIGNAIKFTEKGTISFVAQLEDNDEDYLQVGFSVIDTGIGIPKDKIDFIFESFTQGYTDTYRKYGGTGLGLTITKRLLELQNSHIFVESKIGEGSKFYFSIRFKKSKPILNQKAFKVEEEKSLFENKSLKGIRLLIAEDYHVNQVILSEILSHWQIISDFADNGVQALEKCESKKYDIILMDLQMPIMDGYEATKRIRAMKNNENKDIPIIALTASLMHEIRDQIKNAGLNDCISKPFNPTELFNKLIKYK